MKKLIKSGPGAGYDVTVKGIELDDRNFKILKDEIDERYGLHDVTVEVSVKPCMAEYWSAEAYYDAIDSDYELFDSSEDSKIEGGKAVLFFSNVDVDEGETLEDAVDRLMPSELDLTMMYGGGWTHVNLPEDGIHFDDDNGRYNLDIGEVYDYETISCDLVCPNICQDINAFFENPEEYYDDYQGDEEIESACYGKGKKKDKKEIKSAKENDITIEKITANDLKEAYDYVTSKPAGTWYKKLYEFDDGSELCFTAGMADRYEEDKYVPCCELAILPPNQGMTEYDYDFIVPWNAYSDGNMYEGDVYPTEEIDFDPNDDFLLKQVNKDAVNIVEGMKTGMLTITSGCHKKGKKKGKKEIKSANSYGWEVDSSEVPEALDLFVEYVGKETALEEIARAMGTDVLEENLDWVIRQWGFAEDVEDMDDVWEKFEYAKEVMGADELYENLTQAAGHDELAEDLAFIFRQYDFREWDERKGNIDSGCHGKGKKKGKKEIKSARAESIWYVVANGSKFYYATKEEAEEAFDIGKSVGSKVSGPYEETDPDEIADVYEAGLLASGRKFVKSMARSYLRPEYDARKSFYNKAETDDDKLYSYGTLVAEIVDGEPVLHDKWDYSATTIRHVKEWLQQNGFEAGTKQEIGRKYKKAEN